ncbi:MAG TPA: HGxxPAAW family protein [Yinghuangia sp.]|uniref:HGxxPAAW family protein n=1 Tax=Yinghuangia sp. YIM S10712 TaxID=3436930 RepID=UPI002BD0E70D|nr:HGxxPAAW family protein [Yinghuangia sp.]
MRRHTNPRTNTGGNAADTGDARSTRSDSAPARRGTAGVPDDQVGIRGVHGNHGSSPAAWTGVILILVGLCVGGAGMIADQPWLFWTGIGIALLGAVGGKLLSVMGFGIAPGYHQEGDTELRDQVFGEGGREETPRIPGDPHEWHGEVPERKRSGGGRT